jgi:hypothetical protein
MSDKRQLEVFRLPFFALRLYCKARVNASQAYPALVRCSWPRAEMYKWTASSCNAQKILILPMGKKMWLGLRRHFYVSTHWQGTLFSTMWLWLAMRCILHVLSSLGHNLGSQPNFKICFWQCTWVLWIFSCILHQCPAQICAVKTLWRGQWRCLHLTNSGLPWSMGDAYFMSSHFWLSKKFRVFCWGCDTFLPMHSW